MPVVYVANTLYRIHITLHRQGKESVRAYEKEQEREFIRDVLQRLLSPPPL